MTIEQTAREIIFKESLESFCHLLSQNQIRFLIFKGSALAYDFYKDPALRPRTDSDILIAQEDFKNVQEILLSSGYQWVPNQMELLGQTVFVKKMGPLPMIYDVHWQVFAPRPLRDLFVFDELWASRKKISQLNAFTVSDTHALLLSSVHWVAHHLLSPEPHWIEDIQKITAGRDSAWWDQVQDLSRKKGLQKIIGETLVASQVQGPWKMQDLETLKEPLEYLLEERRSAWSDFRNDIKTMSYKERLEVFCRHLFPSSVYMQTKYQMRNRVFLPAYYVVRFLMGFKKFLQPW